MANIAWVIALAASVVATSQFSTAAKAQSSSLSEAEVTQFLSGRTVQIKRGPATFSANGTFSHPAGDVKTSTWRACGSAFCLGSGFRGALSVENGSVFLTYGGGKRFNLGRKK